MPPGFATADTPRTKLSTHIKTINPLDKGDSVVRDMRNFHGKFASVIELKVKLLQEFENLIPSNLYDVWQ